MIPGSRLPSIKHFHQSETSGGCHQIALLSMPAKHGLNLPGLKTSASAIHERGDNHSNHFVKESVSNDGKKHTSAAG